MGEHYCAGGVIEMFKNRVTELLGIDYPILQGAMAWIAGGALAGAVSQAGALGVIGAGDADRNWVEKEIKRAKALTDRPFGVNLMMTSPYIDDVVDLVVLAGISVVTTGGGNPGRFMERLKNAGIKVIPVVASLALGKRLSRLGADALVVEGMESGGHIGEMSTMCIVPMVVDAVDIPVIAAGGIADGRGYMAAMALGAEGVQIGTRFICATECDVHPGYQQKVIKSRDRATVICGVKTGHPVRAIHNRFTRQYLQAEAEGASKEALRELGRGRYPAAAVKGEVDEGSVLAGQICGLIERIQPAADIVKDIVDDASQVQKRLGGLYG